MVHNETDVSRKVKETKVNVIRQKWLRFKRRVQKGFRKQRESQRKDNTYVSFYISKLKFCVFCVSLLYYTKSHLFNFLH